MALLSSLPESYNYVPIILFYSPSESSIFVQPSNKWLSNSLIVTHLSPSTVTTNYNCFDKARADYRVITSLFNVLYCLVTNVHTSDPAEGSNF